MIHFSAYVTVPELHAYIGVPVGSAISKPVWYPKLLLPNLDVITPDFNGLYNAIPFTEDSLSCISSSTFDFATSKLCISRFSV